MASFTAYNSLGSSIETTEITDGSVTGVKLNGDLIFKEIETIELTSAGTGIANFTSIPTGYKHLKIVGHINMAASDNIYLELNGDSSNIYRYMETKILNTVLSTRQINTTSRFNITISGDADGNFIEVNLTNISTKNKCFYCASGNYTVTHYSAGTYADSTNEIDAIRIFSGSNTTYAKLTLYGAK